MKFKIKGARLAVLLVPALALATPAFAQTRPLGLSDSQEPGSVIVFPKFIKGTVTLPESPAPPAAPILAPASELEIGVLCPKGATCIEHQRVKIRLHWVCPGSDDITFKYICNETDFDVTATVFEKVVFTPNGVTVRGSDGVTNHIVPAAECDRGYLIGWVIRPLDDKPIKFDGLIGYADLRESGTALANYPAIPIQADPALANGAAITTNINGALVFDGAAGHYQQVTGRVFGDVRYSSPAGATTTTITHGFLTLLTLDVKSNRPNNPVFVDLDFFGGKPSPIGNANRLSTSTEFICWEEVALESIDANLTTALMGRKGVFASSVAEKVQIFGITDTSGPTTLLGLVESVEGSATAPVLRDTVYTLFNDSVPIPTRFRPTP